MLDPEELVAAQQESEVLKSALGALSETQASVIRLYYWESMKEAAIAEQMGVSQQAVNKARLAAENKLRELVVKTTPRSTYTYEGQD